MHQEGGRGNNAGYGLHWLDALRLPPFARYLSKKIANFLHEFYAGDFPIQNLPRLPSYRSMINVNVK